MPHESRPGHDAWSGRLAALPPHAPPPAVQAALRRRIAALPPAPSRRRMPRSRRAIAAAAGLLLALGWWIRPSPPSLPAARMAAAPGADADIAALQAASAALEARVRALATRSPSRDAAPVHADIAGIDAALADPRIDTPPPIVLWEARLLALQALLAVHAADPNLPADGDAHAFRLVEVN